MTDPGTVFALPFMQNALAALLMLAVAGAVVGVALNLRGLEFLSDGLVHAVFPGAVAGFLLSGPEGVYPGVAVAALVATVVLTIVARRLPGAGSDAATAVVLAGAFGLGVVLVSTRSDYTTGLEQLLFGQLLTVSSSDLGAIALCGGVAVLLVAVTWKEQLFVSFDVRGARAAGLRVLVLELALNAAIALVVVAASRAVGNLLVLAVLIAPAAIARLLSRRLAVIVPLAVGVAISASVLGLALSYALSVDLRVGASPSAVLALVLVGGYLAVAAARGLVTGVVRRRPRSGSHADLPSGADQEPMTVLPSGADREPMTVLGVR